MASPQRDFACRIGGPQGSGVDTVAGLLARACAIGGLRVFGRREYYCNIMGRHSYYDVRVAPHVLTCHRGTVDLMITFEAESLARHTFSVVEGGGIVYYSEGTDMPLERIPFLDERARREIAGYLTARGLPPRMARLLAAAHQRGVRTFAVPFDAITRQLAEQLGVSQAVADGTLNTVAVAVACAPLTYDPVLLAKALASLFPGRTKVIVINREAVELTYDFVRQHLPARDFRFRLRPVDARERRLFVDGNRAVALGKLASGMTFQTYYPIRPATDESTYLEAHETFPTAGGGEGWVIVEQTEDRLAAVTMAAGAALTGARSATATSAPGFSLMAEGLGWAGMNEVPLVVSLYQRGSPSTGMPTHTEQGGLQFAIHAGHGEFPRIILASGDLQEAFDDAARAFNYAERYQMVVIHLLDKVFASTTQTVPPFDLEAIRIERGELYAPTNDEPSNRCYARFAHTASGAHRGRSQGSSVACTGSPAASTPNTAV